MTLDSELPRGYELQVNCRVRRKISGADEWGIYLTNENTYALIVTFDLYNRWSNYLSIDIFKNLSDRPLYSYVSATGEYIVSDLADGPFPDQSDQVVAFSAAFGKFLKKYPGYYLRDAIYVEEYSLILPLGESDSFDDMCAAYGKWLTGGVPIPGNNIDRLSRFMTWMSKNTLIECVKAAGILMKLSDEAPREKLAESKVEKSFQLKGRPELECFFRDHILDIIEKEDEYKRMGISFPGATILYGPPGCGKTYAVDRLSDYLGWPRFDIESGTVASPYIHDTSKKIAEIFSEAIKCAPSILVIDEMEAFLSNRSLSGTGNHHVEEVAEFLRRIPEAIENRVLIFGMTNMINLIDPAILRRGRFDHIIEVKMATTEEIYELLMESFDKLPISNEVNPNEIAEKLSGHPLSDVSFLLKEAGRIAVKSNKDRIDNTCFEKAYQNLPIMRIKDNCRVGF